jgi:hypothetical protein
MHDFNDLNNPHLVTPTGDFNAKPPKGEPVAAPVAPEPERACDPRKLRDGEPCGGRHSVQAGDFIRAGNWSKPRLVEHVDVQGDGPVLFLAEHDTGRVDKPGIRIVDKTEWERRSGWVRYPNLRRIWDAAHGGS